MNMFLDQPQNLDLKALKNESATLFGWIYIL